MTGQRPAAVLALVAGAATVVLVAVTAVVEFPRGLVTVISIPVAVYAAWLGIVHRGPVRVAGFGVAIALLVAPIVLIITENPLVLAMVLAGAAVTIGAMRAAFRTHVDLPAAKPPQRPVLFYNPRSGGGKATRFDLPGEARKRGIRPVELAPGTDLEVLVRDAIAEGADGLAMAGGDGSQAVVAAIAAETGLPYACIPAGTRNHFALDLGVDRDDVVGALEAFVDGGERVVDLATVNGRVFVNNVSLGVYAEAVQRPEYRDAKLRTLLDTAPDALGGSTTPHLRWDGPGADGGAAAAILVSNNRYRLGRAVGSGTRPRVDEGVLGVAVAQGPQRFGHPWHAWTTPEFEVGSEAPIAADHPGASPSALQPDRPLGMGAALWAIARGRDPRAHA